ncbi:phosphonate degradation associated HDIG domain protein [Dongia mobilis]|uniref:Phosphonate degradation associated HDIG domain protein n=1 Tax=Dongia mobilis TaxID=578943 RepID=A0A4R6WHA3_9PROT|nr:HD domain-containing protein [Dongia mobilis]TDQ77701.1 phosphonate degradation associated HDIG domain protein [Dongia mobilis]
MKVMREIRRAFDKRGLESYGEGVSQLEHALQCAYCAERDGATPALIVATLLHDIGHMLHDLPEDIADHGVDTQHESLGSAWLSQYFGPEVSEPVRLHVPAKRYLATREKGYYDLLSEASLLSLKLQGGLMSEDEMKAFEHEPYHRDGIQLRRWDDEGKIPGWEVPDLGHFEKFIEACAAR